jgi:hypothetical protein
MDARNFRYRLQRIFIRFVQSDYSNALRLRQFAACGEYVLQSGRNSSRLTLNMVPGLQRAAG